MLLNFIVFALTSHIYASTNAVQAIYCRRVINPQTLWTMGEKLNQRYHRTTEALERDLNETQRKRFEEQKVRISRALKSAESAWYQPENSQLMNQAVSDFVAVFDRAHYRVPSRTVSLLKTENERIEEARERLYTLLNWGSLQEKALNARKSYSHTFDMGISSWEDVLLSWALMKPIVALSATPRNNFDIINKGESIYSLARHDTRHYRDFLFAIQRQAPGRFFQSLSELSFQERLQFDQKMKKASMMILRALEMRFDESLFPTKRERLLVRALIFQAIHEANYQLVSTKDWIEMQALTKTQLANGVLSQVRVGFYGEYLKSLSDLSTSELVSILDRISQEMKRKPDPSWIPEELLKD